MRFALTPDGVQEVVVHDVDAEPVAICPDGCHLLLGFPDGRHLWIEVREETYDRWARKGLPVRSRRYPS